MSVSRAAVRFGGWWFQRGEGYYVWLRELMRPCFTVGAALACDSLAREGGDVVLRGSVWRTRDLEIATSHLTDIMI